MRYPNQIRELSKQRKWKQADLSRATGYPPPVIGRFWHGERKLHQDHLDIFARAFKCRPKDILDENPPSLTNNTLLSEEAVFTQTEVGLMSAIRAVIVILSNYDVIQQNDLKNVFSYQQKDFRMRAQPGAAAVMNQLIEFLNDSTPEETLQKARKPARRGQDQSKNEKSLEN